MINIPQSPYVSCRIVAEKYFFNSRNTVIRMCQSGVFKSARKIGGRTSPWQIRRDEVLAHIAKQTSGD